MADGSFEAVVQDISHGSDKVESSSAPTKWIELACEILARPHQGPICLKVEGPIKMMLNKNKSSHEEIEKSEQERKSRINHISVFKNSMLDGDASPADTNADCGNGEKYHVRGINGHDLLRRKSYVESCGDNLEKKSTTDGEQNRTELYPALNQSNHGNMLSNQESPTSEKNSGIFTDCDELGGNVLFQKQGDMGGMDEDRNDDENNMKRDGINSQHCSSPSQTSGTVLNHIFDPMDMESNDIILSPEGNKVIEPQHHISNEAPTICQLSSKIIEPQHQISNETPRVCQLSSKIIESQHNISNEAPGIDLLSSNSGPASLQIVNAEPCHVKFDVDLNLSLIHI